MPTFTIYGTAYAGLYIEVEAENEAAAREKAAGAAVPSLCNQCAGAGEGKNGEWGLSDGIGDEVEIEPLENES